MLLRDLVRRLLRAFTGAPPRTCIRCGEPTAKPAPQFHTSYTRAESYDLWRCTSCNTVQNLGGLTENDVRRMKGRPLVDGSSSDPTSGPVS